MFESPKVTTLRWLPGSPDTSGFCYWTPSDMDEEDPNCWRNRRKAETKNSKNTRSSQTYAVQLWIWYHSALFAPFVSLLFARVQSIALGHCLEALEGKQRTNANTAFYTQGTTQIANWSWFNFEWNIVVSCYHKGRYCKRYAYMKIYILHNVYHICIYTTKSIFEISYKPVK